MNTPEAETCYMCDAAATSREHAPPSCIFPPFETVEKDVRVNLITVPSCDEHNSKKQMDDEYFRAQIIMQCASKSNPAHKHFFDKFMRGAARKPAAYQAFFSPQQLISGGSEIAIRIDRKRFDRCAEQIVRALSFHVFNQKLTLPIHIFSPHIYKSTDSDGMVHDETNVLGVKAIMQVLADAKAPDRGDNPEIFRYRIVQDSDGSCAFAARFYESFEFYAVASKGMELMQRFRNEMPRVFELRDLIDDPSNPNAYFQDFDKALGEHPSKHLLWAPREKAFQRLASEAWEFLKQEVKPYVSKRNDNGRAFQQFVSALNMVPAYNFLLDEGCTDIHFIPRSKKDGIESPDIEARLGNQRVICEVKTLGISEDEALRRKNGGVGSTTATLEDGFLNKLHGHLLKAKSQTQTYDAGAGVRHIAFMVCDFDDCFGEYKSNYYRQIDQHLGANPIPGLEIVIYNQRTAAHEPIEMLNAQVINEP